MSDDFIRDGTALWADKSDFGGRTANRPTNQWDATDVALVKAALLSIQTYLRTGLLDVPATTSIPAASITNATVSSAVIGDLNLTANTDPAVGPEQDWVGYNGRWFVGVDVANAPTSRDFVLTGVRRQYSFTDGVTTSGSPTVTSASGGGFTSALVGAAISGSGIPAGATVASVGGPTSLTMSVNATASAGSVRITIVSATVQDLAYWKHRGAQSPTLGIGVTPPDGSARLQISAQDDEPAMGSVRIRVGPSQTGKVLTIHDSTPTDQWWIDKDFWQSGSSGNGVKIQAEASANGRAVILADNTKATQYSLGLPTGSGGVLRLKYETGGATIMDFGTDASARFLGTKIGFFSAAVTTKPTVTGSRGGNAALASLLTALATLGLITDSTTA